MESTDPRDPFCTPCTCVSALRESSRCSTFSGPSACRTGKRCSPRSRTSPCHADTASFGSPSFAVERLVRTPRAPASAQRRVQREAWWLWENFLFGPRRVLLGAAEKKLFPFGHEATHNDRRDGPRGGWVGGCLRRGCRGEARADDGASRSQSPSSAPRRAVHSDLPRVNDSYRTAPSLYVSLTLTLHARLAPSFPSTRDRTGYATTRRPVART